MSQILSDESSYRGCQFFSSKMGDLIDMVFLHDKPKMDVLDDSWMLGTYQPEIVHSLDMLEIFIVESSEEIQFIYVGASRLC